MAHSNSKIKIIEQADRIERDYSSIKGQARKRRHRCADIKDVSKNETTDEKKLKLQELRNKLWLFYPKKLNNIHSFLFILFCVTNCPPHSHGGQFALTLNTKSRKRSTYSRNQMAFNLCCCCSRKRLIEHAHSACGGWALKSCQSDLHDMAYPCMDTAISNHRGCWALLAHLHHVECVRQTRSGWLAVRYLAAIAHR